MGWGEEEVLGSWEETRRQRFLENNKLENKSRTKKMICIQTRT